MIRRENDKAKLEIHVDEYSESPREWCNAGTMICFHRDYALGDDHSYSGHLDFLEHLASKVVPLAEAPDEMSCSELMKLILTEYVMLPVYLLDHSGLSISTESFNDSWDSGQVGWIFCSYREGIVHYRINDLGKDEQRKVIEKYLRDEVSVYNDYLNNRVYGFVYYEKRTQEGCLCETCLDKGKCSKYTEPEWEEVHSCWGFYEDKDIVSELIREAVPEEYRYGELKV